MEDGLVLDALLPQSQSQAARVVRLREATAELPVVMLPINFDISLPLADIGHFAERCVQTIAVRWPTQRSVRFGHLGDGNLHLTVDATSLSVSTSDAAEEVEALVYGLLKEAGGSISAEHGVGTHKKTYLHVSRSAAEIATMRAIEKALDPHQLLNPGKVFHIS